jgi:hypothetical protein
MRLSLAAILSLCLLLNCSGLPSSGSLSVTITPMTATVKQGATVDSNVTGSGFTQTPVVQWLMLDPNPIA